MDENNILQTFICEHSADDVATLALHRSKYASLSDEDFRFALQQIEGKQRTADKLPLFATIAGWKYPARLHLEQCSSEQTALYKNRIARQAGCDGTGHLWDITGGYGVDTFFLSEAFAHADYYEINEQLVQIVKHNMALAYKPIQCHNRPIDLARDLLPPSSDLRSSATPLNPSHTPLHPSSSPLSATDLLYADPSRRDHNGGKVFRIEDCAPDVRALCAALAHTPIQIMLKLSPMLDIHQALSTLGGTWEVHVVSLHGEVKELLLLRSNVSTIHVAALAEQTRVLSFTPEEERNAPVRYVQSPAQVQEGMYIYEPDPALLKAGAFRLLSARFNLLKADINTHLYLAHSPQPFAAIPFGRLWRIEQIGTDVHTIKTLRQANVLVRNYPLTVDALKRKLKLHDGGNEYLIGTRIANKPILLRCSRFPIAPH